MRVFNLGGAALLALVAWGAAPAVAQTTQPPTAPLLRVEPGMHVNLVRGVAVDAAGAWAVTVSDDKTARVWNVASGAAGPVLRVPIAEGGPNAEGQLQAVAITPDGSQVAVAGRSGRSWAGSNLVYVFERASGRLLRRINTGSVLPVVTLAMSPDGRYLAAGLGDDAGLKLFDFTTGALLHHDHAYKASIYALDFRFDGRVLVAGAADGGLRLYLADGGHLRLAGSTGLPQGKLIAQARFSPDGLLLAVGLEDTPQVFVLDGRNLQVVGTPAPAADGASAFSSLAWSPDGTELWGGGTHREGGQWRLRVWPKANWQQFADRPVASASILGLHTLPGQRVLYVSAEPAWGVVDGAAQVHRRQTSPLAAFNGLARALRVSGDGRRVAFWYGFRQPLVNFDLGQRALADGGEAGDLAAPVTEAQGFGLEGWENRRGTGYNGRRLPLGEFETSRSVDIDAARGRFALGTDERVWLFGADGQPRWQRALPSIAWAVKFSGDGRWVVAALQDGTLRWLRSSDGVEVLSLMPHADRKRWVLWSPSGYFDAAPGAEELLGWHVNRGADQAADFYPMWTLRQRFLRADVLDRVLTTADEARAVAEADAAAGRQPASSPALLEALPPVLQLAGAPEVDGARGEARFTVRTRSLPSAPVSGLRARADGRPATVEPVGAPGAPDAQGFSERRMVVRFSGQPAQLQLMAENRHGLSAVASVDVRWPDAPPASAPTPVPTPVPAAPSPVVATAPAAPAAATPVFVAPPPPAPAATAVATAPPPQPAQAAHTRLPRLYVLAIGIGKFKSDQVPPLDLPTKDARDFVAAMKGQEGKLYRNVEVRLLTDQQATRDAVVQGMDWLKREVTQHDVGMVFVAGHGTNDPKQGYVFIPYDFDGGNVARTAVSQSVFKDTVESLAGPAFFFIDTCHSGNVVGGRQRFATPDVSGVINDLASAESGVVVFSASTGRQEALENPAWGNGAFTKSVVEGLSGKADDKKTGRVTQRMLDYYITDRVKELTGGRQSAVTIAPRGVPDHTLAVLR